jgi:hypothetical protein
MTSSAALRNDDDALDMREALRIAILGHDGAAAQVASVERAIEIAYQRVRATDAELEKADKAIAAARESDIKTLSIATRRGQVVEPTAVKAAREHKITLEDRIEIERGALAELKVELAEAKREEVFADAQIRVCRSRLIHPLLEQVAADYQRASAKAMIAGASLNVLASVLDELPSGFRDVDDWHQEKIRQLVRSSHVDVNEIIKAAHNPPDYDELKRDLSERVRGALADLLTDADAELPQL